MKFLFRCLLVAVGLLPICAAAQSLQPADWQSLPLLPSGLSGQFVGTSDGKLVVINGTSWTGGVWEKRQKSWTNKIYALDNESAAWREAGHLPAAVAYGASFSTPNGIICLGGQDADTVSRKVFIVKLAGSTVSISNLPELPIGLSYFGAALLDHKIYVTGGQSSATPIAAQRDFYALDLKNTRAGWQQLAPLPGVGRIIPVVIAQNGAIYVMSGAELRAAADGKTIIRNYLTDAYRYQPQQGWTKISDLPRPAAGAASTASGSANILIFGGDTGKDFAATETLKEMHPGFAHDVLMYDARKDTWLNGGEFPSGLVTATAVLWKGKIVIAGGEDRPRSRSAQVAAVKTGRLSAR